MFIKCKLYCNLYYGLKKSSLILMIWRVCCLTSRWRVQRHFEEWLQLSKLPGAASGWPAAAPKSHLNRRLASLWAHNCKALWFHGSKLKRHLHGTSQQDPLLSRLSPVTQQHTELSQIDPVSSGVNSFLGSSPIPRRSGAFISRLRKEEELPSEPIIRHQFISPHWSEKGWKRE